MKRSLSFLLYFTLVICFNINHLKAQQEGSIFYNLTTANGLSSNRTSCVIQDRQGFYWIGTLDGLNRFDGTTCKVFQNSEKDSMSLSHNTCISLLEDDKGDIWISTLMGLNRYRKDGKFDRFFFHNTNENFERVNWIWGLTKDSSGNVWVSTYGLWQYNIYTNKWKQWLHDPKDNGSIPRGPVSSPIFDKKRNCLWMSGTHGYILFDIAAGKFYHNKNNPAQIPLLDQPAANFPILLDDSRNIWFFTPNMVTPFQYSIEQNKIQAVPFKLPRGIFSFNKDDRNRIWFHFWHGPSYIYDPLTNLPDSVFLNSYHSHSAISNNAKNLFVDRFGNYWISTWSGVTIFNPQAQAIKYHLMQKPANNPIGDAFVITAVAEQNDSILWLGTSGGLYQYNLNQRKLSYQDKPVLRNNYGYVRNLFFQNDSILWIGAWTELLAYNVNKNKLVASFYEIDLPQCTAADAEGNVWVGTWGSGLYKISGSGQITKHFFPGAKSSETVFSRSLVCFGKSFHKNIWVGYNGGDGFSKFNLTSQQFEHYKIRNNKNDNLPTYSINCIREDDKKNLWLGTFGRGLIYFDPQKKSYRTITQSDGLKGNFINSILADDSSRLWISTTTGINILDTRNNDIIQTDIDLSFTTNDFMDNGIVRRNGNFLFFAGRRLVEIDPTVYYRASQFSEILFSSFKIFDKEVYLPFDSINSPNLRLSYKQNFFSLDYSLLKPNPNYSTQYAYQLEGFDKDWNYVKERRTAYYTNVPPGPYKFRVKATDENGKWIYFSKTLAITIAYPFWQRWWFISAVAIVVAGGLYLFYRYRINQLKKILAIRTKISRDLHDEVGATLSSIHIYSSVAAKAMDKDSGKTRDALHHINENTRQVMENMSDIVWAINADNGKETTLAVKLKNYGYELLTPLNINCTYRIDKEAEKKLTNMEARKNILLIAKEAINNIAKHSQATEAFIGLEITGKNIELEITDNGRGISATHAHTGHGMTNMKHRIELMGGVFRITPEKNCGTKVHCIVPLPNISDR